MKYIVELKEPLWRKWLRRALWVIFASLILLAAWTGIAGGLRIVSGIQLKQQTGLLAAISPEMGLLLAERFYQKNPTTEALVIYTKAALEAKAWDLADALGERLRKELPGNATALAYAISAQRGVCGYALPTELQSLAKIPLQNDEELIIATRVAVATGNRELLSSVRRPLSRLSEGDLADRAALLRAQISLADGDKAEAAERAKSLIEKQLPARDAVELLGLLGKLNLSEEKDYRSALRVRARAERILTLELCDYLWTRESPAEILNWLENLPPAIAKVTEVQLRKIALQKIARMNTKAAQSTEEIESVALAESLKMVLEGNSTPTLTNIAKEKDLVGIMRFGQLLQDPTLELKAAEEFSLRFDQSPFAAATVIAPARKTRNTETIAKAYSALEKRLSDSPLTRAKATYWRLLMSPKLERAEYENLKKDCENFLQREDIRCTMALAHFTLGSTTDALFALGDSPQSSRGKFLRGYLLLKSGQPDKAFKILKEIDERELTDIESNLLLASKRQIEEASPAKKLFDMLKAPPAFII